MDNEKSIFSPVLNSVSYSLYPLYFLKILASFSAVIRERTMLIHLLGGLPAVYGVYF